MKSIPTAVRTALDSGTCRRADCFTITLKRGDIYRFTSDRSRSATGKPPATQSARVAASICGSWGK